jgi:hypothetical protein
MTSDEKNEFSERVTITLSPIPRQRSSHCFFNDHWPGKSRVIPPLILKLDFQSIEMKKVKCRIPGGKQMKPLVASLLLWVALPLIEAKAQVDVQFQPEMQILVLMLKAPVTHENGLPMAKVGLSKVLLRNGEFVKELPVRFNELNKLPDLLNEEFRLYRGPKQFGIYKYLAVPNERKPKKGDSYLQAIPIDKDATVQAMTLKTREQADLLNLLNMTVEEAASAVQNETKLKESLAKAEAAEIALLQTGKLEKAPLFFVPVKAQK